MNLEFFFNLVFLLPQRIFDFLRPLLEALGFLNLEVIVTQLWFITAVLTAGIVYVWYEHGKIERKIHEKMGEVHEKAMISREKIEKNERWVRVLEGLDSFNESDWRRAILEADTILDEMTEKMQYPGETLGERLKAVDPANWKTLPQAWEAHKVRNKIAHEGDFVLTKREARRVIELYREVFEEFEYI